MNEAEAREILARLNDELTDTVTGRLAAEKREASLRKLIDGYLELFPDLDEGHDLHSAEPLQMHPLGANPRGKEAVRRVMEERPGKWYTVGAMTHVLQRRGWAPASTEPENAVRASLERVLDEGPPYFKGRGTTGSVTYSYRPFQAVENAGGSTP